MLWMLPLFVIVVGLGLLVGVFAGGAVDLLRGRQGAGLLSGMAGGGVGGLVGFVLYEIYENSFLGHPLPSYMIKLFILIIFGGSLLYTAVFARRPALLTSKEQEQKKAIDGLPIDLRCLQLNSTLISLDNRWDDMTPGNKRRMEEVVERIAAISAKASETGITRGVFADGETVQIPDVSELSIDEQLTCVELLTANVEEWQQRGEGLIQDDWHAVGVLADIAYPRMGEDADRSSE